MEPDKRYNNNNNKQLKLLIWEMHGKATVLRTNMDYYVL